MRVVIKHLIVVVVKLAVSRSGKLLLDMLRQVSRGLQAIATIDALPCTLRFDEQKLQLRCRLFNYCLIIVVLQI